MALTLIIVMFSGVYAFYESALRTRQAGSTVARDAMLARGLLDRISAEIRTATDVVPGDGIGFQGTHDKITFVTPRIPEPYAFQEFGLHDELPPAQLDFIRVSYQLIWDDELEDEEGIKVCHGLWRTVQKSFDPNPKYIHKMKEGEVPGAEGDAGGEGDEMEPGPAPVPLEGELIAPELKYLRIEYFDGAKWQDRWHTPIDQAAGQGVSQTGQTGQAATGDEDSKKNANDRSLPQAVRITVGRERVPPDDEEMNITQLKRTEERRKHEDIHPDRFTVVIPLKLADPTLMSSRKHGVANEKEEQMGGDQ